MARFMLYLNPNEINSMCQNKARLQYDTIYRHAVTCLFGVCLYASTTAAFSAGESTDTKPAYIDSVYSWGAWEHGLEPAAGPQAPTDRALTDRSRQVQFRPNDNAAYTPQSIAIPSMTTISRPPSVPFAPVTPTPAAPPAIVPVPAAQPVPRIRPDASGPIISGAMPTAPNRRR